MSTRLLGPVGSRRRRRTSVATVLAACSALALTGVVEAIPLPPTPPAVNNPTFEFDPNEVGKNAVLTDDLDADGVLDWDDTNQNGTDRPGEGVIEATRNADGTCTQTNLPATAGGPGFVGAGLLVCDGSEGNFADLDGFTNGSKNEGTNWFIDNVSSPRKADMAELMLYAKFGDSTSDLDLDADDLFIFTGATRLDRNGDTHIDVELNKQNVKRNCPDSEPATPGFQTTNCTPQRTNGDILIAIDLARGGVEATLRVFQFQTGAGANCANAPQINPPCLVEIQVPAGAADGFVNDAQGQIQGPNWNAVGCDPTPPDDPATGCRIRDDIAGRGFMETFTDLSALGVEVTCPGFSNVIFKTRSSDALNSSLQDDAEASINISKCSLAWEKRDDQGVLQGGATFTVQGSTAGPFACLDDNTTGPDDANPITVVDNSAPDSDPDAGQLLLDNICFGTYTVTETVAPTGFALDDDVTRVQTVNASNQNAVIGTQGQDDLGDTDESDFHNRLGTIEWEKRDGSVAAPHPLQGGATFEVSGGAFACRGTTGTITVVDNGTNDADPDAGQLKVDRVCLGTYTITETVPPTDYLVDADPTRTVTVSAADLSATVGTEPLGAPPGVDDEGTRVDGECTDNACDFHNRRGSLLIRKEGKDASTADPTDLLGGATFEITPDPFTGTGTLTITDNAAGDSYAAAGLICLNNVAPGTYSVRETAAPTGYLADPDTESVATSSQSCSSRQTANPDDQTADVTFVNIPLSTIRVVFDSLATGASGDATVASIVCEDAVGTTVPANSENNGPDPARDDTDETFGNGTTTLEPGVYTCTVDIDP
jgi:hypothetical protein